DRDHTDGFRNLSSSGENSCTAEAVTYEDLRGRVPLTKHVGRADDVLDVRREVGVGELALARSEPGEVEPQHADPSVYEAARDPSRGGDFLRTREAVREQGVRHWVNLRTVEPAAQSVTARSGEPHLLDARTHCT